MLITTAVLVTALLSFLLGFHASNQRIPALISHTRVQTMRLLANSGGALDLILAEMEQRAAGTEGNEIQPAE